jgi:hypothetical protein
MVLIDFVAGSHGNFLEYVCNRFVGHLPITFSPFNNIGASHIKTKEYTKTAKFKAEHYSNLKLGIGNNIIRIVVSDEDLLPLMSVCFLRAGNSNISILDLEKDMFNKLENGHFKDLIDEINSTYPIASISKLSPDCPRHIVREFFKFGFIDTNLSGMLKKSKELVYTNNVNVFDFEFSCFYDTEIFYNKMHNLAAWTGTKLSNPNELLLLHDEFLSRQPFKHHKIDCDRIIDHVINRQLYSIPELTVLQESYINGVLEKMYQKEMPFLQDSYFKSTKDIVDYLHV